MKLLDRAVVAILVNELGLHEEVKEKFFERFDPVKYSWVLHEEAAMRVIWFKRLLTDGPISQIQYPQVFGNLLRVIERLQLPGILDKCGIVVNGEGTKERPFSAALRKGV